jgi:hypothetical protein
MMKALLFLAHGLVCVVVLVSCETNLKSAPRVTAAFVEAGARENADAATLERGRKVFLNRCIPCHALPDVARYERSRIPRFVGWMSHRAHLTPEQKEALTKYLLTARSQ